MKSTDPKEPIEKQPEEICKNCGKETFYSECSYCKKCDAAICPECSCNCMDDTDTSDLGDLDLGGDEN
jgi:hypothetical protein